VVIPAEDRPLDVWCVALAAECSLLLGLSAGARAAYRLRDIEDRYIAQMLAYTGGKKGEAAQRLGIDRKTLYRRDVSS
jgi:DNA-binding NtrC family response regulator